MLASQSWHTLRSRDSFQDCHLGDPPKPSVTIWLRGSQHCSMYLWVWNTHHSRVQYLPNLGSSLPNRAPVSGLHALSIPMSHLVHPISFDRLLSFHLEIVIQRHAHRLHSPAGVHPSTPAYAHSSFARLICFNSGS